MSAPVERNVSGPITPRGPTLNEFALSGVELVDQVRAGITYKKDAIIVDRDLGEMAGTWRRSDHVRDKLVVSRATLRLQDTQRVHTHRIPRFGRRSRSKGGWSWDHRRGGSNQARS